MQQEESVVIHSIDVTWEELYKQLYLLLDSIDYREAYDVMNVKGYNIILKRKVKLELKATVFALWHLCLSLTFPEKSDEYFTCIREEIYKNKQITQEIEEIYRIYWHALQEKKNTDFSPLAEIMKARLKLDKKKVFPIKIALYMRGLYTYIHEYLVDMSLEESA